MPGITKKKTKKKTASKGMRGSEVSPGERKKKRTGPSHIASQAWKLYKSSVLRGFGKDKAAEKVEKEWRKARK